MSAAAQNQRNAEREAWIAEQLSRAPRLTDTQRARLGQLLGGGGGR